MRWLHYSPSAADVTSRDADYHDLARTPRHGYVAFYLWLRAQRSTRWCMSGAHGTLDGYPEIRRTLGKLLAGRLTAGLPVIYPFIVNDPGEIRAGQNAGSAR